MDRPENALAPRTPRRDGWTPQRPAQFLKCLAEWPDVRRACARIGLSRQAAYGLRRRDPAFPQAWDGALRSARAADKQAFLAGLPERLLRTMSELSGSCELRASGVSARTASEPSGRCKLHRAAASPPHSVGSVVRV